MRILATLLISTLVCRAQIGVLMNTNTPHGKTVSGGLLYMQSGFAEYTNTFTFNRTNGTFKAPKFSGDGSALTNLPSTGGGASTNYVLATSNSLYALLTYQAPSITVFQNDQNNVEIGSTVTTTILNWTLAGAAVTSQSLNQSIGSVGAILRRWTNSASYTANRTYTLTVSDGVNPASANTSVSFLSKIYWGVSANATLTDGQIIALANSQFATSYLLSSVGLSATSQYLYFAFPNSFGAPKFIVNGLNNTAWTLVTRAFINASGASVSYRIYRSDNLLSGDYTISLTNP